MSNFGAKILNNSVNALRAQQALLAVTANNISNVNTPGYSRRRIELETEVGRGNGETLNIGNGVKLGDLTRAADRYIEKALREALGERDGTAAQKSLFDRLEGLFDITGEHPSIGSTLTNFFTSLKDLTQNPSSLELRANIIQRGQELTEMIRTTYNAIGELQDEADLRIATDIETVNSLTSQIAELNGVVSQKESSGSVAADERDRRDQLLNRLSEKIGFTLVEVNDGSVNLSLANGFSLVNKITATQLSTTKTPSFATGAMPPSLSGGVLSHVVYDYDPGPGTEHIDLTSVIKDGAGSIGGLLSIRGFADVSNTTAFQADGPLVATAARIESIARQLLTQVNQTYLGADADSTTVGFQPSARDLDGNAPATYGLFDFTYNGVKDANANNLPDDLAAINVTNFSSRLSLAISDPRDVAAARDLDPANPVRYAPGDSSNTDAVGALQDQVFSMSPGSGSYSFTGTFGETYTDLIGYVGNTGSAISTKASVAQDNLVTAQNRRDETAAVSLDEEFTNLIKFQKSYQAAARLIKVADEMLQEITQLI